MIVGVSTRLPMDESYVTFHELLGTTVGNVIASALAAEAKRRQPRRWPTLTARRPLSFANISHEFRTPLTLMLGPLEDELAERAQPLPALRRERLATAHRNSLRLLKLVNTLLDFFAYRGGTRPSQLSTDRRGHVHRRTRGMFRSAIETAGLTLTVDCPALPEPVFVDRDMWKRSCST